MDERGVSALIVGFGIIFALMIVWYVMSPAVEEIATFVEDETAENSIAHQAGEITYTIWIIFTLILVILVIGWIYARLHRKVSGYEYG